jgi:hypothetical protein
MKMSEEFPSKYLKAADLKGREIKVIMANVEREEVGVKDGRPDIKPVLYFKDKTKGIVLNKTNATVISDFYGDDSADWYDQPVILYSVMTEFGGKATPGLRVRIPTAKDNKPAQRREDPISSGPIASRQVAVENLDDEIPF